LNAVAAAVAVSKVTAPTQTMQAVCVVCLETRGKLTQHSLIIALNLNRIVIDFELLIQPFL
jgi:hypothetical protein